MLLTRRSVTTEINALLSDQSELWIYVEKSSNIDFLLKLTYVKLIFDTLFQLSDTLCAKCDMTISKVDMF